jgi:branched-chain amino acid transport system ATP-binding protein
VAERGYLLHNGRVVASGPISELRDDTLTRDLYLGDAQKKVAARA